MHPQPQLPSLKIRCVEMTANLGFIAATAYPSPPNYLSTSHRKPAVPRLFEWPAMASSSPNQPLSFGSGPTGQDNAPLSTLNLDYLKNINEKKTTRDGQPQKRRGPKPDSKPALTRRQELNRQAQRTHRERKEHYIKALEDEVLRLKEIFSNVTQDKERLADENRQLRALLAQNGLGVGSFTGGSSVRDDSTSNPSAGYSPVGSMAGSYIPPSSNTSAFTPPPPLSVGSRSRRGGISPNGSTQAYPHGHHHQDSGQSQLNTGPGTGTQSSVNTNLDYEQAGIDFVLTLEKPCMSHLPWMLERGTREPCGHALMASCPPEPFSKLTPDIPFGQDNHQQQQHHHHPTSITKTSSNTSNSHNHNHNNNSIRQDGGDNATVQRHAHHPHPPPPHPHHPGDGGGGTWQLSKSDLATLLDLSKRLNLDGEITPVMAWGMVLAHPRLGELRAEDFVRLAEELGGKVRCYGFGAVMEEFEVRDALENVFSTGGDYEMGY
ncbi:hypothetical protein N658DRAFT_522442 [Parathielavia hyrcaniae]|uniref:BZIP domain-containing protein n=1 Tax=Parathielavia hyrcaniae TaxID=113614 RepID=A0AAN6Q3Q5_9PEZI|nr:hypothetical protein N658DRAFT_522442 [Parathielavia hyrcaniae]